MKIRMRKIIRNFSLTCFYADELIFYFLISYRSINFVFGMANIKKIKDIAKSYE